jgi:catechol 2,3-dioxygenase-like lactoylglutathione lyase family enzyme
MNGRPMMEVTSVTIGAPRPRELADFYARMLGWQIVDEDPPKPGAPPGSGWAQLAAPDGQQGPTLNFEYEAHYTRPVWPSEADQQSIMEHLDIAVKDLKAAVAWAVDAGATLADYQPQEDVRVLFDPAGHAFCLFLA